MYEYGCMLDRIIDGDTVDAWIDLGFCIKMHKRIRLMNIDAWESRTLDLAEKEKGKAAIRYLQILLDLNEGKFTVKTEKDNTGKYGRLLGTLFVTKDDGSQMNINEEMIRTGNAVIYGKK